MSIRFAKVNRRCVRGMPWEQDINLFDADDDTPISLASVTDAFLVVREEYNTAELLRLSIGEGTLTLVNAANGVLGVRGTHDDTLLFPTNDHEQARYVYDIVLERGAGNYEPACNGSVTVDPVSSRVWEDAP